MLAAGNVNFLMLAFRKNLFFILFIQVLYIPESRHTYLKKEPIQFPIIQSSCFSTLALFFKNLNFKG